MPTFNPVLSPRFPRLSFFLSPIIRPQCLVCHRALRPVFPATPTLCHRCVPREALSVDYSTHCRRCGLASLDPTCERCLLFPLPFASLRTTFHYRGAVRDLVRAMKFTPSKKLARVIAQHLCASIVAEPPPSLSWQLIIPIPSGRHSSTKRLFTPTFIAAREVSSALAIPLVPSALSANRSRALQASLLSTKERFQNSREAFTASSRVVRDKHILLVDDVITTGATIAAATTALLDAGAASVAVRAFALSHRFERTRPDLYHFFKQKGYSESHLATSRNFSTPSARNIPCPKPLAPPLTDSSG